jgi:DNA polymerase (family 10)
MTPVAAPAASGSAAPSAENARIAQALREMAALIDAQGGNAYRSAAYGRAADTVAGLEGGIRERFEREGEAGLDALPGVGPRIAAAIAEMLVTGGWRQLEHLRGDVDPQALLRTVPGVGPELANRVHEVLGVDTLEALEAAAHDGRLERLPRVGARRAAAIRAALTEMLDRRRALRRPARAPVAPQEPSVEVLLDVDRRYREAAAAGTLRTIAPRRFNPRGEAWLPVLHVQRGDWHLTALWSNTARAHQLGRVRDWLVVYAEDPTHGERQYTVVTESAGPLAGLRVVRGREAECGAWHRRDASAGARGAHRP